MARCARVLRNVEHPAIGATPPSAGGWPHQSGKIPAANAQLYPRQNRKPSPSSCGEKAMIPLFVSLLVCTWTCQPIVIAPIQSCEDAKAQKQIVDEWVDRHPGWRVVGVRCGPGPERET
jgi:hypothetical protein